MYMLGRHSHVHSFSICHVDDSNVGQGWSPLTQVRQVHSVGRGDTAQPRPIDPLYRDIQLEQQLRWNIHAHTLFLQIIHTHFIKVYRKISSIF